MEETWLQTAESLQLPSTFTASTATGHYGAVTILANGSRFLYLLDLKGKKLLAIVKFPCTVVHVSDAVLVEDHCPTGAERRSQTPSFSSPSVAVCCLSNGCIAALPLQPCLAASTEGAPAASRVDDIFTSLLETAESDSNRNDESADIALPGDKMSICISKLDSSLWTASCAMVFEDRLVVCKKSKKSGEIYVTLFISSERSKFRQLTIPKFHGAPVTEFLLSKSAESALSPITTLPSGLQYRPLLKVILPSQTKPEALGECIEPGLFHQLFRPDCPLSDAAVLLVCGPNGHILYCNLRSITRDIVKDSSPRDITASSNCHELFKPLYSLDQPVMSIHFATFPKRHELLDPLLFCGEDSDLTKDNTPNSLIFVGQRGKVTLCFADAASISTTYPQKFPKFVEYNIPGPILSSELVPGQCLVYNSFRTLHRICLRQECFKEVEEHAPQLQLRREPLLIPEASFKFPERVEMSIPPSVIVECVLVSAGMVEQEDLCEKVGLTLAGLKGDLCALKVKVCGVKEVSRDPDVVAKEIKQCLNSIQTTSKEISATSGRISKMDNSLSELNHVLTLLCTVKCHREEGAPVVSGELGSPVQCAVSASFMVVGVLERAMCIDVRLSYQGKRTLGSGWSLLIQVSPSTHESHDDHMLSKLIGKEGSMAEDNSSITPTTLTRTVPLEGLTTNGTVEERIAISSIYRKPLYFSVSCYLHYNSPNLLAALGSTSAHSSPSCDHTVSVLLSSRLLDALDFTQPLLEVSRRLHNPLTSATSCLDPDNPLPLRDVQQGLLHSLQLPIKSESLSQVQQSADQPNMYGQLSVLLLPHIEGVEEMFRHCREIRLICYDGSAVSLRLLKRDQGPCSQQERLTSSFDVELSLVVKSSSRSQLAEVVRCVTNRFQQRSRTNTPPPHTTTQEELYRKEAELKGISREAVSLLDGVNTLKKFSREPSATERAELLSKTFSLYSRLRQLPPLIYKHLS